MPLGEARSVICRMRRGMRCHSPQTGAMWWSTPSCNAGRPSAESTNFRPCHAVRAALQTLHLVTSTQTWSKPSPPMAVRIGDPAVPLGSPSSQMRDCRWQVSSAFS